jgi:hypothetical protein
MAPKRKRRRRSKGKYQSERSKWSAIGGKTTRYKGVYIYSYRHVSAAGYTTYGYNFDGGTGHNFQTMADAIASAKSDVDYLRK